jgi:uncharacterized tellurite resistance protein B-like protein
MSDKEVILKLGRVMIAAAWADGEISNEEVNCLKDLLFLLRQSSFDDPMQISAQEWARLDMYIETPVDAAERERLVADLQDALRSDSDKQLAIKALQDVVKADGVVSDNEREIAAEIQQAIESVQLGGFSGFQRLIGGTMQRRSKAVANAPNRERYFDDFIQNKVYYSVNQRLQSADATLDIPDAELRRLSLAGGLMAKVAQIDREVSEAEFNQIVSAIRTKWNVSQEAATFVAEVAVSAVDVTYDIFRMMREMVDSTTEVERRRFLVALFAVANAEGGISHDEHEEIRLIARGLNLTHKDFIDAKMKVIDEPRTA